MLVANNIAFSTLRKNGEDLLFAFYTAFYAKSLSTVPEKTVYFYNTWNYFAAATEAKIFDARDNVLEILDFVLKNGSNALERRMRRKAAMFACDLFRAQKVYQGQQEKFRQYLETLSPFVDGLPEDIVSGMSPYQRRFTKALILRDFDKAYRAANQAHQLHELYNSWPWCIKLPIRWIRDKCYN